MDKEDERTPGPVIIPWSYNDEHKLIEDADGNAALTNISSDVGPFVVEACNSFTSLREALHVAEQNFEAIRKVLINNLDEPERSAFWLAVRARDQARAALNGVTQPATNGGISDLVETLREIEKQCIQADDPEHHTLSLVKHMARNALARFSQPSTEVEKISTDTEVRGS